MQQIVASRVWNGKLQYQVKWEGWEDDSEWYPARNFKHATDALYQYHYCYPNAAGPPKNLEAWAMANYYDVEAC